MRYNPKEEASKIKTLLQKTRDRLGDGEGALTVEAMTEVERAFAHLELARISMESAGFAMARYWAGNTR